MSIHEHFQKMMDYCKQHSDVVVCIDEEIWPKPKWYVGRDVIYVTSGNTTQYLYVRGEDFDEKEQQEIMKRVSLYRMVKI